MLSNQIILPHQTEIKFFRYPPISAKATTMEVVGFFMPILSVLATLLKTKVEKLQGKPDKLLKIPSSKFEEFFEFTTFYTTFGRKDMLSFAAICHREKMVGWWECFETPGESGISWYKFA